MPTSRNPRVVVRRAGEPPDVLPLDSGVARRAGIDVEVTIDATEVRWAVANTTDRPVSLDAIGLAWTEGPVGERVRVFANGYQSWSASRGRLLGHDRDPSLTPGLVPFLRNLHHADPEPAEPDELRSELVTLVDLDDGGPLVMAGFLGGAAHEGTLRLRPTAEGVDLRAEAWFGGAALEPGERRPLHTVMVRRGDDASALLDGWARAAGRAERARIEAPYLVGWCSWYHYFHQITEQAFHHNLRMAADWPFSVFQLDDGFQAEIGDWLLTNDRFPSGVAAPAAEVEESGRTPGLWLAPFLAAPRSRLAAEHPEYFARDAGTDEPLVSMWHPEWGGFMWQLDTTRPEVLDHLERTARQLREMGYRYLKLDFTFSPTVPGRYADPGRTPAQRVRAGYEAVRRGAGEDAFILACGCPLGSVIGVVDAMRIGSDVAPRWEAAAEDAPFPGYEDAAPSTRNAWVNTLTRSFMHRRLWLNDPDCLMLRTAETALQPDEIRAWALAVGLSGGLAVVSDDLALLDGPARRLLDEVLALGRAADDEARTGPAPRCPDLFALQGPARLEASGRTLEADPASPRPVLRPIAT